jgi:hypothetical protein
LFKVLPTSDKQPNEMIYGRHSHVNPGQQTNIPLLFHFSHVAVLFFHALRKGCNVSCAEACNKPSEKEYSRTKELNKAEYKSQMSTVLKQIWFWGMFLTKQSCSI